MFAKPTANTACHQQNNALETIRRWYTTLAWQEIPFKSANLWHRYTCNRYPNEIERLDSYCDKESNSISDRNQNISCWMPWLKCHICKCPTWMKTDIEWKCCRDGNTDKNWKCCPTWETPNENWECGKDPLLSPLTALWPGQVWSATSQTSQQTTWDNNQTTCLRDSKWNCCKKIYYDIELGKEVCCEGILLNTSVPFIGQCIVFRRSNEKQPEAWLVVDEETAFPILMWGLSKILVSIILLVGFVWMLVGGVMISASGGTEDWAKKGKKIIWNIISALALLWASWVILRLINPNFFW